MATLMHHKGIVFKSQVIYATGHAYEDCRFELCTIVCKGFGMGVFKHSTFAGCVWHLDVVVHDGEQWDAFITDMAPIITKSLPRGA